MAALTGPKGWQRTHNAIQAAATGSAIAVGGAGSVAVQAVLAAAPTFTCLVEGSIDNTTWVALPVRNKNSGASIAAATGITAGGIFEVDCNGLAYVRARVSAMAGGGATSYLSVYVGYGLAQNPIASLGLTSAVNLSQVGGAAVALGQAAMASSIPVVVASNQSNLPVNTAQINGVAPTMGNGVSGTGVQRVTIASDSTGQVALAAGAAVIGSLAANQSVNVAQMNGVAPTMGNGVSGTGVQRVTLASDSTGQVALAAGAAVIGSLAANQSVNTAQMNGVAVTMGNGVSGTGVQRVTLASDSTGQVVLAAGANVIGSLAANQSVNTAQINGVAPTMGNGVSGTGVQRVTLASDSTGQVALAAGAAVIGSLAANQSVNTAQINGVAPTMGNGVSGTGVQRVTIASDSTGQVVLATGAAVIGSLAVNQSVNVAQMNGVATAMDDGATSTGTQRVILARPLTTNIVSAQANGTGTAVATDLLALGANKVFRGNVTISASAHQNNSTNANGTLHVEVSLVAGTGGTASQRVAAVNINMGNDGASGRAQHGEGNISFPFTCYNGTGGTPKFQYTVSTAGTVAGMQWDVCVNGTQD